MVYGTSVDWSSFKNFVKFANPKSSAKFIQMETFFDESIAPGQKQDWYPYHILRV